MSSVVDLGLFEKARDFARVKHEGQIRKDGSPYFEHPVRVANLILKYKDGCNVDELVIAAILHDTLEDTDTGISELRENFGEVIALLVVELTTDKLRSSLVGKARYLADKFSNGRAISNWGLVIKLADRLDNVSDLDIFPRVERVRRKKETLEILRVLEKRRKLTRTHRKLIAAIRSKLEEVEI